jgi:hypothetical protein
LDIIDHFVALREITNSVLLGVSAMPQYSVPSVDKAQKSNNTEFTTLCTGGACDSITVEALRYKSEGRGFAARFENLILLIYQILPPTLGPWVTQPLTDVSTRHRIKNKYFCGVEDSRFRWLATILPSRADCLGNAGFSTSHNLTGLYSL